MLTLHHLVQSRSTRIVWALEELKLDYQIKIYQRLPTFAAPPELKAVHPLGKSPVLVDDDFTVDESAVILEYLQGKYDLAQQFKPQNAQDVYQYNYWMHYAEGSLMPLLVMQLVMNNVSKHVPFLIRPVSNKIVDGVKGGFIYPRLKEHVSYIENYLAQHDYFAGEFSFADIQMAFPLEMMLQRIKSTSPHIQAFLKRVQKRAAYQAVQAKNLA